MDDKQVTPLNEPSATVLRLRQLQVKSVAGGVVGGLAFLIGLAFEQIWLAYAGVGLFILMLAYIITLGLRAAWVVRK